MTEAAHARLRIRIPLLLISSTCWGMLLRKSQGAQCGPIFHHQEDATMPLFIADWLLMLGAMMAPGLAMPMLHIRTRSLSALRMPLLASFTVGYLLLWLIAGVLCMFLARSLGYLGERLTVLIVAFGVVLWQCAPLKQRCLNRCHAAPALAPFGRAAILSSFHFGWQQGWWCAGSCWALMLLTITLQPAAHLSGMLVITLWVVGERQETPSAPRWAWRIPLKALRILTFQSRSLLARAAILPTKRGFTFQELTSRSGPA